MSVFEILASMASIISFPLAIYYARKNNNTTCEKARLDIIKTLSYRLSDTHTLTIEDINSVYKSKIKEHKITHVTFNQKDILNDLKSDIMSNAFLSNDLKNNILFNLSSIYFEPLNPLHNLSNGLPALIIRLFISPIPFFLLVTNIIVCVILLYPHIIYLILHYLKYNELNNEFLFSFLRDIFFNIYIQIAFINLLILSVINFFRIQYIKIFSNIYNY